MKTIQIDENTAWGRETIRQYTENRNKEVVPIEDVLSKLASIIQAKKGQERRMNENRRAYY